MRQRRGCGSALTKRSQKVYCGNACQASTRRKASTKLWLESGQARIDGVPNNNRRENLRLICPNCDSQPATYKSRNRGKGRYFRRQRYADGQSY